jgi:hypothetical protein
VEEGRSRNPFATFVLEVKLRLIIVIFIIANLVACTTIKITDHNGAVRIERSFGFASIEAAPDAGVVSTEVSSLGYLSSPIGHSIGFSKQVVTSSDDACRVIIWLDDNVDSDELLETLQSIDSVCFIK